MPVQTAYAVPIGRLLAATANKATLRTNAAMVQSVGHGCVNPPQSCDDTPRPRRCRRDLQNAVRTHYFWTGLEVRFLVSDPSRGAGFWFITVNRSRSEGLSGFTGLFVRRRVRSAVQSGALASLSTTKRILEASR